jgi:hypothetical protein
VEVGFEFFQQRLVPYNGITQGFSIRVLTFIKILPGIAYSTTKNTKKHEGFFNNYEFFLCVLRGENFRSTIMNMAKCAVRNLFRSQIPDAGAKNTAGQAK